MIPPSMRIHLVFRTVVLGLFFINLLVAANGQCRRQTLQSELVCEDENLSSSSNGGAPAQDSTTDNSISIKRVILNLPGDQRRIWTSPFHLHPRDSAWLLPVLGTTAVLLGSDRHSMARARSNPDAINLSSNVSDGGVAAMLSLPVAMYAFGSLQGSSKARETGLLSGEALINSLAVDEALKVIFERERPTVTDGHGRFFQTLNHASFPSTHSALSWTVASVISHEYPGGILSILSYSTAAAVSIARVTGREHFPSDVVVGAALGWLIGRQVYRAHHDEELDGPYFGAFVREPGEFDREKLGSSFVPLDSWVYPELERLAALGYIRTQFVGLRPWTRRECIRQIEEAEYFAQDLPPDSIIVREINQLKAEFSRDNQHFRSAQIDDIYARFTGISSAPLRDSYHFGQTVWNDFGRPYDQGGNVVAGASASAVAGRFFFYVRGEYQHAPGRPALTPAQQNLINSLDGNIGPPPNPVGPAPAPVSSIDRFYPVDMYAGVQMGQYALSFGKQSLWLGPGVSGPLMVSDNADPMYMLRLSRTSPWVLPFFLKFLGQVRGEFLVGKLSGHQFPARPFFNLQKISFHPTKNLEIGFTRSSLWAGVGHPFNAHALSRNLFTLGDTPAGSFNNPNDLGDRKSGFDFSYRLPGLRNWLTLYTDSYSDDDPSPLANPRRAAINPGLYLSHFPMIPKLDLRVEMVSTQSLTSTDRGGQFLYWNFRYHDSNLNKGFLFGNATGRDGRSYHALSTYHFSAATSLQFGYRDIKTSAVFLPGGGTQSDATTRLVWQVRPQWSVDSFLQYERWLVPALRPGAQHDFLGSFQITFYPKHQLHD
ncbi:MAG TPA: capsule assembly Wzi family protein [Candidatus Angelobacter sp.]|nr:capsule assembly Wzi family protein [Candidatus Angelobacter sp.]